MRISIPILAAYLAIVSIAVFALFYNLGTSPLACWDESRQAINALEMLDNQNPLITTFEGETDLWNTKPSFLVATQALSFKIFGINEFALRLPSALAALLLCILIFSFFISEFKSIAGGFVAVLSLLTTQGFNGYHAARTGDFESFLCLFSTFFIISFYRYIKTKNQFFLLLFFIGILLTIFSKGIAGLMFLPAVIIYLLYHIQLISTLRLHSFQSLFLTTTLIVLSYYLYRDFKEPGYLAVVYVNELWGRFGNVVEGNRGPWYYYLQGLTSAQAMPLSLIVIAASVYWFVKLRLNKIYTKPISFFWLFTGVWIFFISIAKTKLAWYIVPAFPLLSILLGVLYIGISRHFTSHRFPAQNKTSLKVIFICLLFFCGLALRQIVNKPLETCEYCIESSHFGLMINEGIKQHRDFNGYCWATGFPYYANQLFYIEKLKREKSQNVTLKKPFEFQKGDKVFLLQPTLLTAIPAHLKAVVIAEKYGILEVELHDAPN